MIVMGRKERTHSKASCWKLNYNQRSIMKRENISRKTIQLKAIHSIDIGLQLRLNYSVAKYFFYPLFFASKAWTRRNLFAEWMFLSRLISGINFDLITFSFTSQGSDGIWLEIFLLCSASDYRINEFVSLEITLFVASVQYSDESWIEVKFYFPLFMLRRRFREFIEISTNFRFQQKFSFFLFKSSELLWHFFYHEKLFLKPLIKSTDAGL